MNKAIKDHAFLAWGLALALLILIFFAPALKGTFIFRDAFNLVYPYKAVMAPSLRHFSVQLWNPWETMGSPFVGELATGWFYPANVFYMLFSVPVAFRLYIVSHYLMAALFMFAWLRDLKISPAAAACGSLSFTLSGWLLSQNGLPDMLATAAWLPGSLFFLGRWLERRSALWFALFSASLAMPFLAGKAEGPIIVGIVAAAWIAVAPQVQGAKERTAAFLKVMPAAGLFALALAMAQFLPSLELGRLSAKGEGFTLGAATLWSLHPQRLLEFIVAAPWGRFWPESTYNAWELTGWKGHYPFSVSLYMGLPILIGSLIAPVRASWKNRILIGGALVLAVLASFGDNFFLYPLLYKLIAPFRSFRYPERYMLVAAIIISASGAWGLSQLLDLIPESKWSRRPALGLAFIIVFADLWFFNRWIIPYADPEIYRFQPAALSVIQSYDHAKSLGLFDAGARPRPGQFRVLREQEEPRPEALALVPGASPLERYSRWERHTLMPNFNFTLGIEELTGYTAAATADFDRVARKYLDLKTLELYNVRFVISPAAGSYLEKYRLPLAGTEYGMGFKVFHLPDAFPRAYLIGRSLRVKKAMDNLELLRTHEFRQSVVLEDVAGLPAAAEETDMGVVPAEIAAYAPQEVRIRARAPADAYLVLSDSFYPGWEARVDGKPAPIFRANFLVRAVRVPAGESEVVFRYRPYSGFTGRAVSLAGLAAFLIMLAAGPVRAWHGPRG
ncbi:MAG TPA: hypothetical protein VM658_15525 [bacterium]|nr:hypothetical protein [bacterium]